jgi:hypothetical protein
MELESPLQEILESASGNFSEPDTLRPLYKIKIRFNIIISWFQTFAVFWMLRVIFWVVPRRVVFNSRRFVTLSVPSS